MGRVFASAPIMRRKRQGENEGSQILPVSTRLQRLLDLSRSRHLRKDDRPISAIVKKDQLDVPGPNQLLTEVSQITLWKQEKEALLGNGDSSSS